MERDAAERLRDIILTSRRAVFFGGAGVSTESGIPDFRGVDGLYRQQYDAPPEVILSHRYFLRFPDKFFEFYRNKMLFPDAVPNAAHRILAGLEAKGRLAAVVTQNIDGLHTDAGSRQVFELHGCVRRNHCADCGKFYPLSAVLQSTGIPRCSACGGIIKPDVVLYEEPLPDDVVRGAVRAVAEADTLLVAGTSLNVYPAAGLLDYFHGNTLVLINLTETNRDTDADLCLHAKVGEALSAALPELL